MSSSPARSPKWKNVELAVYALWTYFSYLENDGSVVRHDVKIKDPDGDGRQLDVAMFDAEDNLLRVVEVQNRADPLDKGQFGGFVDKMGEVGAPKLDIVTREGTTNPVSRRVDRENEAGASISTYVFDSPSRAFADLERLFLVVQNPGRDPFGIDLDFETRYLRSARSAKGDPRAADIVFGAAAGEQFGVWATFMVIEGVLEPFVLIVSQGQITDAYVEIHLRFDEESGKPSMATSATIKRLPM